MRRAILLLALLAACARTAPQRVDAPADSAAGEIDFTLAGPSDAAILVPVTINGEGPWDFVLDTGATITCVNAALADSLELPDRTGTIGIGAGVGSSGRMRVVDIDSIRVGPAAAYDLAGCVVDLGNMATVGLQTHGLLGLNFLRPFRMTLDFEREVLTLVDPRARPAPSEATAP